MARKKREPKHKTATEAHLDHSINQFNIKKFGFRYCEVAGAQASVNDWDKCQFGG